MTPSETQLKGRRAGTSLAKGGHRATTRVMRVFDPLRGLTDRPDDPREGYCAGLASGERTGRMF